MTRAPLRRAAQAGFTLIELMVSLAIGMAVVGALLAAYFASFSSSRHSAAMTQIAEDATLALNVIRGQVAQAGYSKLINSATPPDMDRRSGVSWIFGCEGTGFTDPNAVNGAASCGATGTGPDAIEVAYEVIKGGSGATAGVNGVLVGGVPADCVGNAIAPTNPGVNQWYLNDSKFYVNTTTSTLYCHGPGTTSSDAAPLVDHVEDLQIRYGHSGAYWGKPGGGWNQVLYYGTADQTPPTWDTVAAVWICVQVRSADKVINPDGSDPLGTYIGCDNVEKQSTDGYLHRTFSTTVVLQSMIL
jgi:type IV pilus assembly protein PilW